MYHVARRNWIVKKHMASTCQVPQRLPDISVANNIRKCMTRALGTFVYLQVTCCKIIACFAHVRS